MSSDSCALSLQPFKAPVAVLADVVEGETPRADVFDLLNIVPYIRKFKTSKYLLDASEGMKANMQTLYQVNHSIRASSSSSTSSRYVATSSHRRRGANGRTLKE
jgi:hypothetical protein